MTNKFLTRHSALYCPGRSVRCGAFQYAVRDRWSSRRCAAKSLEGSDAGLRPAPEIARPKSSNYFADVNVHFDKQDKGQESGHVLDVPSSDPMPLAEMADGDYRVQAGYEGQVEQ